MDALLERLKTGFQGNADALLAAAQELVKTLNLDQEAGEGNERLLRHYVSMGVVDKPAREGRDALYGFRHLVQFVAARRLLAEGFNLAKIAKYTAVVPTEALTSYLEKSDRASEAELLVAAFKAEPASRSKVPATQAASANRTAPSTPSAPAHRTQPAKTMPSLPTGLGMADVMHEMREMEHRVQVQLQGMRQEVQVLLSNAIQNLENRPGAPMGAEAFKGVLDQFGRLMEETVQRFDKLLQKPTLLIEKQIDQQRYMFEEAHRQKAYLDKMFGGLLQEQRSDLEVLFERQHKRLMEFTESQYMASKQMESRLTLLESTISAHHQYLQEQLQAPRHFSRNTTPDKKEGAA